MIETDNTLNYDLSRLSNADYSHGMLPAIPGTKHYQVLRANRQHFELADGFGWTYNHAPMLCHWNGMFYLQYLSNPSAEHTPPGHTLLTWSADGRDWARPEVVFPVCKVPDGVYPEATLAKGAYCVMHQRMGFYVAENGTLLILGFYGVCATAHDNPNDGRGIARVVREVKGPGEYGEVHVIRWNTHAGWRKGHLPFPDYQECTDSGFVDACDELLANPLYRQQWWEEDRSVDGFYPVPSGDVRAFCWYALPDGRTVGLWKFGKWSLSEDNGETWATVRLAPSLIMAGGKVWGQKICDGRYALVYNPSKSGVHRWPLAMVVSDDGLNFSDMRLVNGRASVKRYSGHYKDHGFNYVRGITPGNGDPDDGAMWVCYSMHKEDIWISRVPVSTTVEPSATVLDDFSKYSPGDEPDAWSSWNGKWCRSAIALDDNGRSVFRLSDQDPLDGTEVRRFFKPASRITIELDLRLSANAQAHFELLSPEGLPVVHMYIDENGQVIARGGGSKRHVGDENDGSASISITADATSQTWEVAVNDGASVPWLSFLRSTNEIESIAISTKRYIATKISPEVDRVEGDLPIPIPYGVEEPTPLRTVDIRSVSIRPVESGHALN